MQEREHLGGARKCRLASSLGVGLWVGLALWLGCASPARVEPRAEKARAARVPELPDYAAPTGELIDLESHDPSDVTAYRTLTRDDFRGTEPPGWTAGVQDRLSAATCGYLLTSPEMSLVVTPLSDASGFEARLEELDFFAQIDRRCSWWNPKDTGMPDAYTLEHEQIHFALFELEARELDARADVIRFEIQGRGPTREAAIEAAGQNLHRFLEQRIQVVLERSRSFDAETSLGYEPEAQARWLREVNAELGE